MNAEDKLHFLDELVHRRSQVRARARHFETGGDGADGNGDKESDPSAHAPSTDADLLAKIDHVLRRISTETFEQCEGCGGRIALDRLHADPLCLLCNACEEANQEAQA